MPEVDVQPCGRRVLVVGAYGLIGSAVARRLRDDGCKVVGLGRNADSARSVLPDIAWVIRDLADLCSAEAWRDLVAQTDFVVNCAGALQDGGGDDLDAVHCRSIAALAAACARSGTGVVQISAVGAEASASTQFMASKAAGDAALEAAGCAYWIFRPGLVMAPTAYGGSALLRMLAVFPVVQPLASPEAMIQTVSMRDVAQAVSIAVHGKLAAGVQCDLVEDRAHSLREIIAAHRGWMGLQPARSEIVAPQWLLWIVGRSADVLGLLGWRSPLRSTAIKVLSEGVSGQPAAWTALNGAPLMSLSEMLADMPARVEDRRSAYMALLAPVVYGVLFVFWLASGLIGLMQRETAAGVLIAAGWPADLSVASVVFWSFVDVLIAVGLLVRKWAGLACWAMVIVSLVYLLSSSVVVPHLWLDPLGPLVKVLPGIVLALVARAMLETR